jgi:hypothetical protein
MAYIQNSGNKLRAYIYNNSPYLNGDLRKSFTALASNGEFEVFFKIGGQNAPHGTILNDNAIIRGKKNKHYKWANERTDEAVEIIAKLLGGIRVQ